jgi:surface antigen
MILEARSFPLRVAALTAVVFLAACTKQQVGQATGGALGGYLGSKVGGSTATRLAVTAAGALAGSLIGGSIGRTMDDVDRMKTTRALESAPTGTATSWQNPDSGANYTVTPTRTFETASGPCREFTTQVVIDGRSEQVVGTACRQADGSWAAQG